MVHPFIGELCVPDLEAVQIQTVVLAGEKNHGLEHSAYYITICINKKEREFMLVFCLYVLRKDSFKNTNRDYLSGVALLDKHAI